MKFYNTICRLGSTNIFRRTHRTTKEMDNDSVECNNTENSVFYFYRVETSLIMSETKTRYYTKEFDSTFNINGASQRRSFISSVNKSQINRIVIKEKDKKDKRRNIYLIKRGINT